MRVALVRPFASSFAYDPELQEPLGIESLASFLREAGHEVLLSDLAQVRNFEQQAAEDLARFEPDIVGLSIMSDASLLSGSDLVCRLTHLMEKPPVFVAGGSLVTTDPTHAGSMLPAGTRLIRFEGEMPLLRLVEELQGNDVRQVSTRAERIEDLDALPWPARDLANSVMRRSGYLNVQGSRGCVGKCAFCCAPMSRKVYRGAWRGRSPSNIVDELAHLHETHGAVAFNFVDDDFLGPIRQAEQRACDLAKAMQRKGLRIGFGAQFRPDSLSPTAIECLKSAGLAFAFVGVENTDPATLRMWNRPPTVDRTWAAVENLKQAGMETSVGAILFHPLATLEQIGAFKEMLSDIGQFNYRTATSRLHLLPGSQLYEECKTAPATGPWAPAIECEEVEQLHQRLVFALAPLRPAWVHAASLLPGMCSQLRGGAQVEDKIAVLQLVLAHLDACVLKTFDILMQGDPSPELRAKNRSSASIACGRLLNAGLAPDVAALRRAILAEDG